MIRTPIRRPLTLYRNHDDLRTAILATIEIMTDKASTLVKDKDGYYSITELCSLLKQKSPALDYINNNHIVELYFKDKDRKILISGIDQIKYKDVRYVLPPDVLYFGTTRALVDKMVSFGIRSGTKGYIKLYETPEKAANFAKKFSLQETPVVLKIDSRAAFSDGLKFSTFLDGEFIAVRIDKKYIIEEVALC